MQPVALAPLPRRFYRFRAVWFTVLVAVALGLAALLAPGRSLDYRVTDGVLTVDLRLGLFDLGRSLPASAVASVHPVDTRGARRRSGSTLSGLCRGEWTLADGREVWLATTCAQEALLLERSDGDPPWVVAPADAAGFTAALAGGPGGHFAPPPGAPDSRGWQPGGLVPSLLLLGLAAILTRAGRGLSLQLGGGRVRATTGWRAVDLPLEGTTVRRGVPSLGRLMVKPVKVDDVILGRTRGTEGSAVMLLTDRDRAVELRPAEGLPLVVSPEDPEAFVAACVAGGARPG